MADRPSVLTHMVFLTNRNALCCCCGARPEGFPECSSRRWDCSIFPAIPSLLQSKEIIDLKVACEEQWHMRLNLKKNRMPGTTVNEGFLYGLCLYYYKCF